MIAPTISAAMRSETESLADYEHLDDVRIQLHAELDHKTVGFEQLLNLTVGSVLPFGRPTGENVDIYAENVLLGTGEILIVDSTLAVRIADLRNKPSQPPPKASEVSAFLD